MNKDKKNVIVIVIIIAIIVISLIVFLSILWRDGWFTNGYSRLSSNEQVGSLKISSSNISKYLESSIEEIDSKVVDTYITEIIDNLSNRKYNDIYIKLDEEFKENNNLSEYNIEEYLKKNGLVGDLVTVEKITRYMEIDNIYVYRLKIVVDYVVKFVNLIEKKPYEYTLNFEQETVPVIGNKSYYASVDELQFETTIVRKQENAIVYDVKITNKGTKRVTFDFTTVNSVILAIDDGGFIKQPSSVLEEGTDYILNKDSYFVKRFYFPINMQYQKDINSLGFYNVKIGNVEKNIYIKL